MSKRTLSIAMLVAGLIGLAGCSTTGGYATPLDQDEKLVKGPAMTDVVTPFDQALTCLDGRFNRDKLRFSVGAILDATGKEQMSDAGTGKFVTQGAGDIVQSALFQAGVTVLNRRDPRVVESEARWGIRDTKALLPSTFYITGSINSLDFLPGSGFEAQVAGVGPRYRQHRILVALDLSLTETATGKVVANIPLQKQIVAAEEGFGVGRFFGSTLVSLDAGNQHREALSFAMRQMLNLATFELLTQLLKPQGYEECWSHVEEANGVLGQTRAARKIQKYREEMSSANARPSEAPGAARTDQEKAPDAAASPASESPQSSAASPAERAVSAPRVESKPATQEAGSSNVPAAQSSDKQEDEQAEERSKKMKALELHKSAAPSQ